MECIPLKSLILTGLILILLGCSSSPSVKLNAQRQSELQVAILNDDVDSALRIIEHGSVFDVKYVGWEPTAPALALKHNDYRMIEAMVLRFGPENLFLNWGWDDEHEAACEHFLRLDARPNLRPLLQEMAKPDEPCQKQGTTFAALVKRNGDSLSEETLLWALGDNYQEQLLIALKADPASALSMLAEQSPEDMGFSNQDALIAAQIGGHRAAIDKIISYGADPDKIGTSQWGDILCESMEIGSHERSVLIQQLEEYGEHRGPCGAFWHKALWDDRMAFFDATLAAGLYETSDLNNMLETAEFRKNVPATAILAKHFGLSSLNPAAKKRIIAHTEAKKTLYSSLDKDGRHEFVCQLLAIQRPLDSGERQMVAESVFLARRCENGQLPVMVSSAVPDNFEFVYNLDPTVYRRQVTKTDVLKAALDTGKPDLIESVAERSGNLLSTLEFSDLRGVINQPELLGKLESRGLSTKHRVYADLAGRCNAISNKDYLGLINQSFFTNFGSPLANSAKRNNSRNIVLAAYRDCLDKRSAQIRGMNIFRNSSDERPEVSADIYAEAKARTLYAMTLIAPLDLKRQDAIRARKIIYEGYESIRANVEQFKKEATQYAALQRQQLQQAKDEAFKRREEGHDKVNSATWKGLGITALIGGVMAYNDLDASEVVEMGINTTLEWSKVESEKIEREFFTAINAIDQTEIEIPRIEDARTTDLDKDGVRILIPRYGSKAPYGSLSVDTSYDHTHAVVRLRASNGSSCTGAVLSGQRILTAQHCIVDNNLNLHKKIRVRSDYFSVAKGALFHSGESYSGPWKYTTANQRYAVGSKDGARIWQNDWAILEPVNKSDRRIPQFMKGSYLKMMDPADLNHYVNQNRKLTIAGYAGHLNYGIYLTMDWGCSISSADHEIIEDRCLGFKGDSGSPVVASEGSLKGQVVAIRSYGYGYDPDNKGMAPSDFHGSVSIAHVQKQLNAGKFITGVIE